MYRIGKSISNEYEQPTVELPKYDPLVNDQKREKNTEIKKEKRVADLVPDITDKFDISTKFDISDKFTLNVNAFDM